MFKLFVVGDGVGDTVAAAHTVGVSGSDSVDGVGGASAVLQAVGVFSIYGVGVFSMDDVGGTQASAQAVGVSGSAGV